VTFESGSKLSCIQWSSFSACRELASVQFERGSHLGRIEMWAFAESCDLEFLFLPAALVELADIALIHTTQKEIVVEDGNRSFRANGSLLMDSEKTTIKAGHGRKISPN
jgi:hypothetical protein